VDSLDELQDDLIKGGGKGTSLGSSSQEILEKGFGIAYQSVV
jgi:hypothetical protein